MFTHPSQLKWSLAFIKEQVSSVVTGLRWSVVHSVVLSRGLCCRDQPSIAVVLQEELKQQ